MRHVWPKGILGLTLKCLTPYMIYGNPFGLLIGLELPTFYLSYRWTFVPLVAFDRAIGRLQRYTLYFAL